MGKNINFSGQPVFNQLIKFIDKSEVRKIAKKHGAERYVKKFSTYNHVVVMLFVALEGYHSIREVILGLLANAHKLFSFSNLFFILMFFLAKIFNSNKPEPAPNSLIF